MTASTIVPFLFIFTLLAVAAFAFVSKKRTEERMNDDTAEKSTLAADAPNRRKT